MTNQEEEEEEEEEVRRIKPDYGSRPSLNNPAINLALF